MSADELPCRACGGAGLAPILDMGGTPLANRLLRADQLDAPEPTYPLRLVFCPACALVQITETVPPEVLFSDYLYFSSFSQTMLDHAVALVETMVERAALDDSSLVVELASNDGYLLQYYKRRGVPVLGVEPAANVAAVAERERGIPTAVEFFDEGVARRLGQSRGQADVIHGHNVLAHVADLNGFVAGIGALLKPGGVAVIEAPYVRDMVENIEFDTIYHEHLCYFSLTSLCHLFEQHGMTVADVERVAIHGGSLRIFVRRLDGASPASLQSRAVEAMLEEERSLGMTGVAYYRDFGERVARLRGELTALLTRLKAEGQSIAAYGASAKGSTLLNYFGIGQATLDFVVDRSTHKQGLYTPGTHLPILAPEALFERMPDAVLLLTWNFRDEILAQQAEYRERGGRFIVPIPRVEMV
jgi:SAM-dependent methyltransferase